MALQNWFYFSQNFFNIPFCYQRYIIDLFLSKLLQQPLIDAGGVYRAKKQNNSRGAQQVNDTRDTRTERPIDQMEAEIVEEVLFKLPLFLDGSVARNKHRSKGRHI